MDNIIVLDNKNTTSYGLHSSIAGNNTLEFHQRVFTSLIYGLMLIYHCIRGYDSRLIFNNEFIHSSISDNIPPGNTNNITAIKGSKIEYLWSNINNYVFRLFVSPLYGLYIIMHTVLGSNIYYTYSKNKNGFVSSDKYCKKSNKIILVKSVQ